MQYKGQILLITVMLLATVMTIVLSVSFKSVTDTQVTKLEEESQKALAAAESAMEVALKNNSTATLGSGGSSELNSVTGFSGSATIESLAETTFTTSIIPKDGSYTFYLGEYHLDTKAIDAPLNSQNITVCFTGTTKPAIEITLIKTSGVKKYVVDPDHDQSGRIVNALASSSCTPNSNYSFSTTIPSADIDANSKFLLVRVLYASTKLLFHGDSDLDLPVQGRTVSSQATSSTSTGVSKKVVLFQSYPQIPDEFFSTSF